jgi:hypothetical protein
MRKDDRGPHATLVAAADDPVGADASGRRRFVEQRFETPGRSRELESRHHATWSG